MFDFLAGQGGRLQKTTGAVAIQAANGVLLSLDGARLDLILGWEGMENVTGASPVKLAHEEGEEDRSSFCRSKEASETAAFEDGRMRERMRVRRGVKPLLALGEQ